MEAVSGTYPCEDCSQSDQRCEGCEMNNLSEGRFDTVTSISKIPLEMEKVKG